MKRSAAFIMAAIFLAAGVCFAQQPGQNKPKGFGDLQGMKQRAEDQIKAQVEKLTKDLSLTMEQASKLKGVLVDYSQQIKQIMAEAHEKVRALHLKEKESIKALLTPEQKSKFDTLKENSAPVPPGGVLPAAGEQI